MTLKMNLVPKEAIETPRNYSNGPKLKALVHFWLTWQSKGTLFLTKYLAWEYSCYPHHKVTLQCICEEIKKEVTRETFNLRNFPAYDLIYPFPLDKLFKTSTSKSILPGEHKVTYGTALHIHEIDFLLAFKFFKILRKASKKPVACLLLLWWL